MPTDIVPIEVQVSSDGARTAVAVRGEVDLTTAAAFEDVLCEVSLTATGPVEVDLSGLTHLDCRGLAALASCRDTLAGRGHALVLRGTRRAVRKVIALAPCDLRLAHR